jgi:hypothetical protein
VNATALPNRRAIPTTRRRRKCIEAGKGLPRMGLDV